VAVIGPSDLAAIHYKPNAAGIKKDAPAVSRRIQVSDPAQAGRSNHIAFPRRTLKSTTFFIQDQSESCFSGLTDAF
jgi:hypothetical protein